MGYACLDRAGAERIVRRLAHPARNADEREARECQASEILDQLFCSFGEAGEDGWPQEWMHVSSIDVICDRSLHWRSSDLRAAAESYLEHASWLHCREMDWLIADMLAYVEVTGTARVIGRVPLSFDSKAAWGMSLLRMLWIIAKWLIWVALALFLSSFGGFWLYGWVMLTAWQQAAKWWARRKKDALLIAMLDTYQSL